MKALSLVLGLIFFSHAPAFASESGLVKWFSQSKGFGFLYTETGDLFVLLKDVADFDDVKYLTGNRDVCVSFDRGYGPYGNGKERAVNVKIIRKNRVCTELAITQRNR